MSKNIRHYEESAIIPASAEEIFAYADNHANFSSHMNKSSWMMGGGRMITKIDEDKGQKVGSHIRMSGKVFGFNLFLDEVVILRDIPFLKEWKTFGDLNLFVIGQYKLGFEIKPEKDVSKIRVYIDYDLPESFSTRILGYLFGGIYAKWCVRQMINGVKNNFK